MTNPSPDTLASHHCVPCEGGTKPLTPAEYRVYLKVLADWQVLEEKSIQKEFSCANFAGAVKFFNSVAQLAEQEGHHPDIDLHDYKKVTITLTTHAIDGLSINDFVMATKINQFVV